MSSVLLALGVGAVAIAGATLLFPRIGPPIPPECQPPPTSPPVSTMSYDLVLQGDRSAPKSGFVTFNIANLDLRPNLAWLRFVNISGGGLYSPLVTVQATLNSAPVTPPTILLGSDYVVNNPWAWATGLSFCTTTFLNPMWPLVQGPNTLELKVQYTPGNDISYLPNATAWKVSVSVILYTYPPSQGTGGSGIRGGAGSIGGGAIPV